MTTAYNWKEVDDCRLRMGGRPMTATCEWAAAAVVAEGR